ncbi:MAG TPA: hypothetical protein VIL99_18945 [Ignavibacteria bacterium]
MIEILQSQEWECVEMKKIESESESKLKLNLITILTQLRDKLFSKSMSGEVRVNNFRE